MTAPASYGLCARAADHLTCSVVVLFVRALRRVQVFGAVKDIIIQAHLADSGLM